MKVVFDELVFDENGFLMNLYFTGYNIPWSLPTNFHPDLIATIPQGAFFHSAPLLFHQSYLFRSVSSRRTMIPGKIFTGFAEFQIMVSVDDFWFPLGFRNFCKLLWVLVKFCFCTDTLGSIE